MKKRKNDLSNIEKNALNYNLNKYLDTKSNIPPLTEQEKEILLGKILKTAKSKKRRPIKRIAVCAACFLILLGIYHADAILSFLSSIKPGQIIYYDPYISTPASSAEDEAYKRASRDQTGILKPKNVIKYQLVFDTCIERQQQLWNFRYKGTDNDQLMLDFEQKVQGNTSTQYYEDYSESKTVHINDFDVTIGIIRNDSGTIYHSAHWKYETMLYSIDTTLSEENLIDFIKNLEWLS